MRWLATVKLTCLSGMATELSRELFPDDILWFLQDMERETIDEVDTLICQIEVNTDEQPLSSTQQADSASAVGDNFANADSVELKGYTTSTSTKI